MMKRLFRVFLLCFPLLLLLSVHVFAGGQSSFGHFMGEAPKYLCSECYSPNLTKQVIPPTCMQEGKILFHCNNCGHDSDDSWVYPDEIKRLPHNYVNGVCTMCGQPHPDDGGSKESPVAYDANAEITTSDNIRQEQYGHLYKLYDGKKIRKHFYGGNERFPMYSYLFQRKDGNYTRVEAITLPIEMNSSGSTHLSVNCDRVVVEDYTSNFQLISSKALPMELDTFGGFYAGKGYNFLIFGQNNSERSDEKEVIRVVK